ncbi:MAM and LDL-receptor class A domain-containing protein 2-like isoform X2 [Hydractinia symbiolongicarpus]|uniref:MAM and LDL-receptor class A domain-containing protein 2-like isoform X2 n=1 Tax=Hydractinia symbiolongicarpus TaxID=13093 RepID=UPI00254F2CAB|nr:MAM and LDL-receptor class A domain-containing protein 2-like isoform X2 [Hydractinia symbiolongicarpus]
MVHPKLGHCKLCIYLVLVFLVGNLLSQDCDFEKDTCKWTQSKTDKFDWSRQTGSTGSSGTGPKRDHTSTVKTLPVPTTGGSAKGAPCYFPFLYNKKNYTRCIPYGLQSWCSTTKDYAKDRKWGYCTSVGYYMFIEASSPRRQGDNAMLISPAISNGPKCFHFWYHMYGPHIDTLNIYTLSNSNMSAALWRKKGTQGNKWFLSNVTVGGSGSFQIVVEAIRGKDYKGDISVDDFKVTDGSCDSSTGGGGNSTGTCTFEKDKCGFQDDTSGQFMWKRHRGRTSSSGTGPSTDHTLQTSLGYYMYVEASGRQVGNKGRLSKTYNNLQAGGSCLEFYYHMFGFHQGTLNVFINPKVAASSKPSFSKAGQQGNLWVKGQVSINTTTAVVVFEGITSYGYQGDMAIDDITILPGICASPGQCNFEKGLCTWYNLPISSNKDNFDWILGSGSTSSSFTGPTTDSTGNAKGQYLFLEASSPRKTGDKTRLVSELFNQTSSNGQCFIFFYHMYGSSIGSLNIYVNASGGEKLVWTLKGEKGNRWLNGQVNVGLVRGSYKVIVEGVRGNGYTGDIALDTFSFKPGSCVIVPSDASPNSVQTTALPATSARPTKPVTPVFDCNFEAGLCNGWLQDVKTDQLNWTLAKGATASSGTGPAIDHTLGTKYGQYVYLEVSYKRPNQVARLISAIIPATGDTGGKCLTFWYHMYGPDVNTLNVYVLLGGHTGKPLWSRSGTQGNKWIKGQVTLIGRQRFQAVFEATVGKSYQGDIALDDISVSTKKCLQPTTTCTFENNQCGYIDDRSSDVQFQWTWQSRATSSSQTGPTNDHTLQSGNGFYMFTEASNKKNGDKARILSPVNAATQGQCLQFWYHMYGADMGTLSVFLKVRNVLQKIPIWSESGDKGNVWKIATKTISSTDTFQIAFEGKIGSGFRSDIAIDDIKLSNGPCAAPGFCDFENGMCSYRNVKSDTFDWIVGSAGTPSSFTGPKFDHTLGNSNGSYVYLEVSSPIKQGDTAILMSQQFNSVGGKPRCLNFWYHMFGADIGTLQVVYKVFSGSQPETLIWNLTGQQHNSETSPWKPGRVPISMDADHVIMFKGIAGKSYKGDIAIDDIQYTNLACSIQPPEADPNGKGTPKPTTPLPQTRPTTIAPSTLGCNFEKDWCSLQQDSSDVFNWTRKQGFTDSVGTGPSGDHTFGRGAVQRQGPGSIKHSGGKCIHVLNGAFKKPKEMQPLVVYNGCGQDRLEFVLQPDGSFKMTMWKMCIAVVGGQSATSGAKIGLSSSCNEKWTMLANGAFQHQPTKMCISPYLGSYNPPNNQYLVVYKECSKKSKQFVFVPTMGWYAFIETSKPRKQNDTARLLSPPTSTGQCLNFWYHMYGAHVNKLNVYVKNPNGPLGTPIWSKYGSHGDQWRAAHVYMNYKGSYQYVIEAIRGNGYQGDISIDDIQVTKGACQGPLECSFEETNPIMCGWTNAKDDQFDWSIGQGKTSSVNTGPSTDHTYNDDKGKYVFIETSGRFKPKSIARLVSPNYPGNSKSNGQCFQFWYHMYGSSIGELNLYVQKAGQTKGRPSWTRKTNQGNKWTIGQIAISSQSSYKLIFEAMRGTSYTGDIALDDFKMFDGPCNRAATCDFENDKCTWKNTLNEDTFDWIIRQGNTPSRGTGPLTDHSKGNGDGKYIFIEASSPRKKGDVARLVSEQIGKHYVSFIPYCLRFWYNMKGASIGTLNLYIKTGPGKAQENLVWSLSGNQGSGWRFASAPMYSKLDYQMVFEAIHGGGSTGDIALDDIVYSIRRCPVQPKNADPKFKTTPKPTLPPTTAAPTVYSCNYEQKTLCQWVQDGTDNFNWTVQQGHTSSSGTGPSADHTIKNSTGSYLFMEASYPRKNGDKARILSPVIHSDRSAGHPHCLKFWFHMYGPHIKALNVYTKSGGTLTKVWTRVGDNGNFWRFAQVDLTSNLDYQAVIEGVRGVDYKGDISIDDVEIVDDACPLSASCDFEHGFCGFTADPNADFNWLRNKGSTASVGTGPPFDHTLQTNQGYYAYTEASGRRKNGDKARLVTKVIADSNPKCLEFWYHMKGWHIGQLNVYVKTPTNAGSLVWMRKGNHGNQWKIAHTNIRPRPGRQIVFEGVRGLSFSGDIAIDDIVLLEGYCPPPGDCSFEGGMCSWRNVKSSSLDQFDWIMGSGSTPSIFTGPSKDHTTGTNAGKYMYIEASTPNQGDTAWLVSEDFYPTLGRCVQFWAHMYGGDIGTLNVYILGQNGTTTKTKIWTLSGAQGNTWLNGQAPITSISSYQIVFEAVRGGGSIGDIAIDDITFTNFLCANLPTGSVPPPQPTTPLPTLAPTTKAPTPAPTYYTCNFTYDKCTWQDDKTANFTWTRKQGHTSSSGTGPGGDHTTGTSGWYIFIETSYPRKQNETARLISADVPATGQACFQFWYHMYGDHIENLTIYQKIGTKMTPLWRKSGTQGIRWHHGTVDISSASKFQVVIEGIAGTGYRGDIAVDDLNLNNGACPPSASCTFEDPKLCGWSNMPGDNFDWTRDNAGTSSSGTGPPFDHTYQTAAGFYMYIEASNPRSKGHKAWLKSAEYTPSLGRCLSFWYHMYGTHIHTLNVLLYQNGSRSAPIWSLSGNQGYYWRPSRVTFRSSVRHSIIFEGRTGASYRGDIAIDDVMITEGPCPDAGNCDFERDGCGYTNIPYGDQFDWQLGSGTTSSVTTGPTTDHSLGTKFGRYLFIESSAPRLAHETAIIRSETIPSSGDGKCVQFWYHMYGDHIGSLEVNMRVGFGLSETIVWKLSGNQGNKWIQAQAPLLSRGQNLEIRFEGIRGTGYKGDIAIDDIIVVDYTRSCPVKPAVAQPWGCNFELDFCRWRQSRTDNFDWKRNRGHTGSTGTGPGVDHTTNTTKGYYAYIEASWPRKVNDTAAIYSPVIPGTSVKQTYCVWFAYHMYGPHVDTLRVYTVSQGQKKPTLWQRKGSTGPQWRHAEVQVTVLGNTQVVIEAVRGTDYKGDIAIDDLDIWYGDCFSSGVCTFEGADICRWYVDTSKQLKWQRGSSSTPSTKTGPSSDHTYGTAQGHYMYIETSVAAPNSKAYMYSPWYYNTAQKCIQFFYHMYGNQIGSLDIYMQYSGSRYYYRVFSRSGNQNNTWHMGQLSVTRKGYFRMVVRGTKGQGYQGDIAVDDFRIREGSCPALGDCDFEHIDFCSWTQEKSDKFDWIIGSGATTSVFTGPQVDHTTQTSGGYYGFIETSSPRQPGDKAAFKSVIFSPTTGSGRCMSFWYHMYGASIGTLNVYYRSLKDGKTTKTELIWQLSGNQANNWIQGRVPIVMKTDYQVVFEAVRGSSYTGDIALDDIEFTTGSCKFTPTTAWPKGKTTMAPTQAVTTIGPTAGNTGHDCNFDVNFCPTWITNATGKHFEWRRHQGKTSSIGTGPRFDHTTKSDQGYYVYIESSYPAQENDTAWLVGQNILNPQGFCLSFWYHMYGPHAGTLNVYARLGNLKWRRIGTQGDKWKHGQFNVYTKDGAQVTIIFEGIRGKGYAGDIALDDITVKRGSCPAERECTFENTQWSDGTGLLCGWTQDKQKDDFDWTIGSGQTPSTRTGPTTDHTLKTNLGHYVYIETSSPRRYGQKARMISQSYSKTSGQCFTFWYHIYGSSIGNVTLLQRVGQTDSPLWSRAASEGDKWYQALVTVRSRTSPFQLVFEGTVGKSYTGDIAIDDILLVDESCPAPGNCDFEDFNLCTYTQEQKEDDFDWIRGSGSTGSWRTGPKADYTKKDSTGHYYFIEASAPRRLGDKARLVSEVFQPTSRNGRCLQFYRHMYGTAVGKFNVYVKTGPGNTSDVETLVWSDSGNQGDSWIQSQAPVYSGKPFRLVFEAIRGSSYKGDIAIDDINFNNNFYPCSYIPSGAAPPTVPPTTITPADSNCTFDSGICRWKQSKKDDFDWTLKKGKTGSTGTGPLGDHTSGNGQYIYLEASFPRVANDTAVLRSPAIRPTVGFVCFSFYYHMHGAHVNSLYIYKIINGRRTRIWKRIGTQGNQWRRGQVNIRGLKGIFYIEVQGVRGLSYQGDISLDDFVVTSGKCPPPPYCDFENGRCGFKNIGQGDKFNWKRSNGGTPSYGTGPSTDHTTGTKLGSYFYIETSSPRRKGDNAVLYTRKYPASKNGNCLNFWYHMYGSHIGALNIYLNSRKSSPVWNKTDNQGNVWRHGRVTIKSRTTFRLYFEGIVGSSYRGDIAIDDVWIDDFACPAPGECDFESNSFCTWNQVPNAKNRTGYDNFDWELRSGGTPSYGTGPVADHTKGTSLGTYAYIEVSSVSPGQKAQLMSESFPATDGKCFSIWYHMYGSGTGSLNFLMKDGYGTHLMKSIPGNQGNKWIQGEVGLHSRTSFQVIIEAVRGSSYNGDISIDDINIKDGNCVGVCSSVKPGARVACGPGSVTAASCVMSYGCCYDDTARGAPACYRHPGDCLSIPDFARTLCGYKGISQSACTSRGCCYDNTAGSPIKCFVAPDTPTPFPSTVGPPTQPPATIFDCNFEKGFCNYVNVKGDQMNWQRHNGSTASWGTGPKADHTLGNANGYYAYIETSYKKTNDTAVLMSPLINFPAGTDKVCVRFWYHMYGQHVGSFKVYYVASGNKLPKNPLWQRTGSIVNEWTYAQFTVPRSPAFKIAFQGVRGPGYQGDIAIDDIGYVNGACPPNYFCDFETNDFCGWTQDADDDFDWRLGFGNTTSHATGPRWDHTYGTGFGNYMYIEGSYPRQPGDKARIESFDHGPTKGTCVEFYYHMRGSGIGTLNVYIRRGKQVDSKPAWQLSREQGNEWERALITVVEDRVNWRVILEGIRGSDYNSDIAIDDIHFHKGACVPKGDCDFESRHACGYENLPDNKVDWLVYSGATPSFNTGPTVDHTTGTKKGYYIYMESSAPARKGDIARLASEKFKIVPNYDWCVQFWYQMYGTHVGALRVRTRYVSKYSQGRFLYSRPLFERQGNHDYTWLFGQANITSSYDFQVIFEGEIGTGTTYQADIALDDIRITEGLCTNVVSPQPTPNPCAVKCMDKKTCVPSNKVCDFVNDCVSSANPKDYSDEIGCSSCDFENGWCKWKDNSKGVFDWNRQRGKTGSYMTGPTTDHTKGNSLGYYVYVEASLGTNFNLASLDGPVLQQAAATCYLTFWYHMYGSSIGELVVYIKSGLILTPLWKLSGNQGNKWQQATVYTYRQPSSFQILFRAVRATSYKGDIALDDIQMNNCALPTPSKYCNTRYSWRCTNTRACVSRSRLCDFTDDCGDNSDEENCYYGHYPYRCNFEYSFCYWKNLKDDQFDFTRTKGSTDSFGTGPMFDHSTGKTSGYYIYAESSWQKTGDKARIASGIVQATAPYSYCYIRFYYHMFGDHIGKLSVKTRQCKTCPEKVWWSRSDSAGNFWVRRAVAMRSDKPFQVIIETERGTGYKGDIALDDITFGGCSRYYGLFPTAIPTTPTIPTQSPCKQPNKFYCIKDKKCIDRSLQCDYRLDCSDGQDEDHCGTCDFEKDMCGYTDISTGKYEFKRSAPLTDGSGNGPSKDHTTGSKKGNFALTMDGSGSSYKPAVIESASLSTTSPSCKVQFYYYSSNIGYNYVRVSHVQDVNKKSIESILFYKSLSKNTTWQKGVIGVGQRPQGWMLRFQGYKNYIAYDDIKFVDCALPKKNGGVCNRRQVSCDNGACIYPEQMCDFSNDCGDKSDEKPAICQKFVERCDFEKDTCNWYQDQSDDFDWTRSAGSTGSSATGPGTDHTTGHRLGYYMYIETSAPRKTNDTARLKGPVFIPQKGKTCTMRFFYHMYGEHVDTLFIKKQYSADATSPMPTVWSQTGDKGDIWRSASVNMNDVKPFRVVIEAKRGVGYKGDISIDDISFTSDCKVDFKATLNPNPITPSPPPGCKSGQYSCGDGQCIDAHKVCNFVADCNNKKDESRCPASCDFEGNNACSWFNTWYLDVMDWKVHQGKTPSNDTGPPFDHTKGTKEGYYLYMEANQRKGGNFPNAHFVSPMYYMGAYDCKFTFWYNMYHAKVSSKNDARLNILYRKNGRDTQLWTTSQSTGDKWKQAVVQLPRCPRDFRMIFEGHHYWGTKTDAAIDDWKFDCAEKKPDLTCNSQYFQCTLTKQCISKDDICDNDRNCCDGSDEDDTLCKGYTKLDFESGLHGWVQLQDQDTFDFDIQSGKTTSSGTGPATDHTLQEEHGKYIYIEASTKQSNDTAMLASPTIAATGNTYANGACFVSFWYHMYGAHIGSLTVYTATTYGVPDKSPWSLTGDQGDKWLKAKVTLTSPKDFQIIFVAQVGTSYKGDISLDDIILSPGCVLNKKSLPGGPTQPPIDYCFPDFTCRKDRNCVPSFLVCDFTPDCKDGTDEDNVTCGYPQGFENGFKPWTNDVTDDLDFTLQQGATPSSATGPTADARNDPKGYYAYLEVSRKKKNHDAILTSPVYGGSFAYCKLKFYYHMYGANVGILRVHLLFLNTPEDAPKLDTILFERKGDQGNRWRLATVSVGRRVDPFFLNFTANVGGGGVKGDIAIDEISFVDCAHPPPCTGNDPGKFICQNANCINPNDICNFIDDCGDSSDENVGHQCNDYLGCNFEDDLFDPCNFTQDSTGDDFDWTRNKGWTPSYNTGPTRDHTYGTKVGHYMYIESSGRKQGKKARLISLPMKAKPNGQCKVIFYYHMDGMHSEALNVYVLREAQGALTKKFSVTGTAGDMWVQAVLNLANETGVFRLIFEGIVGKSYKSDIAIDDVVLNPDCTTNTSRVFPTNIPCRSDQFTCRSNGRCLSNTTRCNGKNECRDGSDESGCGGTTGKSIGDNTNGTSIIAAGVVGGLVILLIIILIAYIVSKRRKEKKLHLFSVFYDPTKQPEENKKKGEPKGVSIKSEGVSNPIYDDQPMGEFSMGELDTDMFADEEFAVPAETKGGATSMANPLYQDPYMEDDDSPLSNF